MKTLTRIVALALLAMFAVGVLPGSVQAQGKKTLIPEGRYPKLGVSYVMQSNGAVITSVVKDSPAWKAGLEIGDQIIRVDGYTIGIIDGSLFTLSSEIRRAQGGTVRLDIQDRRTNRVMSITVPLVEQPPPPPKLEQQTGYSE